MTDPELLLLDEITSALDPLLVGEVLEMVSELKEQGATILMQAIFETLFDIVYLSSVVTLGVLMVRGSKGRRQYLLYGAMAVTLGCGDSFHLVPRAIALCTTGLADYTVALGIGKLITSITMKVPTLPRRFSFSSGRAAATSSVM